ncbi:MAG: prepilin-type N-terminal cleavage/methylation domain-containing protein [Thermodesulfovibrionales bacterium]
MWLNNRGFSLLESLVAASILAIAVTALLQVFSSNLRSIAYSEDHVRAYLRADEVMKEICLTKDISETTNTIRDPDGTMIFWEIKRVDLDRTKDIPLELFQVTVRVSWKKDLRERVITLTTYKSMTKKV